MKDRVLVDASPLVAFLVKDDQHREWACAQFALCDPPLLTCEPVLTEACYLIRKYGGDPATLLEMVNTGGLQVAFQVEDELENLTTLMRRYHNVPMSLADACLVRMSEIHRKCRVMTTDSHFRVYRRNGRAVIPLLAPW